MIAVPQDPPGFPTLVLSSHEIREENQSRPHQKSRQTRCYMTVVVRDFSHTESDGHRFESRQSHTVITTHPIRVDGNQKLHQITPVYTYAQYFGKIGAPEYVRRWNGAIRKNSLTRTKEDNGHGRPILPGTHSRGQNISRDLVSVPFAALFAETFLFIQDICLEIFSSFSLLGFFSTQVHDKLWGFLLQRDHVLGVKVLRWSRMNIDRAESKGRKGAKYREKASFRSNIWGSWRSDQTGGKCSMGTLTISPRSTTFSPRIRNTPRGMSPNESP